MAGIIAQVYLGLLLTLVAIAIVPAARGWHATVIQTGSMQPHIDPGDVVVSSALSDDAPVPVGGVVQYRSPATAEPDHVARLRMHRIVTANDDGTYVTAGDANAEVDSTPPDQGANHRPDPAAGSLHRAALPMDRPWQLPVAGPVGGRNSAGPGGIASHPPAPVFEPDSGDRTGSGRHC